ncbi:MAG: ABC transporter ATP-binding protein [Treponematales bacterium]
MREFLELDNVSFAAQDRVVVRDFSHRFAEGKTTALAGPSGSGKTTALKLAAGLLVPSGGEVRFRGRDVFRMNRKENLAFHRAGGVVFQDSALWANQSLRQILELPLTVHFPKMTAREKAARIQAALEEVGCRRDLSLRPSALSIGEQKLVAFARAIITRPEILYLDEWTESLDDAAARRLTGLVKARREQGRTVIFVSHDFALVRDMADFVVMMKKGRVFRKFSREEMEADESLARSVEEGISA